MSAPFKSIPHATAFDVLRNGHGVILTDFETARLATALQGVQAIAAVLQQRELDSDQDPGDGLSFDSNVAHGLIAALATCAEFAEGIVDHGGLMGARAAFGSPAYDRLIQARNEVTQAQAREEGGQQ